MTLPRSSPSAQGVDPDAIAAFVDAVERERLGLHSFVIARHGAVVAEGSWHPYQANLPHLMFSVSKSFTSTAIGMAHDEGLLDIDEPLLDFFPGRATAPARTNTAGLKLRHLLSMATGHEVDTMTLMRALPTHDWIRIFLESPIVYPPGARFLYNSGASYVLSAAIAARTGQHIRDYLAPRLFEPLDIPVPAWQTSPEGIELGASGLRLRTEDMTAFGLLYLQRGLWHGRRVLSERWIDAASAHQVATMSGDGEDDWGQGYGFQFWLSRHGSYRADGAYGQFVLILPEQDAIVAITSGTARTHEVLDRVWQHLLPGFAAAGMPSGSVSDGAVEAALSRRLCDLALPGEHLSAMPPGPTATLPDGMLELPFNRLGVARLSLSVANRQFDLVAHDGRTERHPLGSGPEWGSSATSFWPHEEMSDVLVRSRGGWTDDGRFRVVQQCIETPFARVWTFTPDVDEVAIDVGLDNGFWRTQTEHMVISLRPR